MLLVVNPEFLSTKSCVSWNMKLKSKVTWNYLAVFHAHPKDSDCVANSFIHHNCFPICMLYFITGLSSYGVDKGGEWTFLILLLCAERFLIQEE